MNDQLLTRAVTHHADGRATVTVRGEELDVTASPPPLRPGEVLRWTPPAADELGTCPDCGERQLDYAAAGNVPGFWRCQACGSEFLAGREARRERAR